MATFPGEQIETIRLTQENVQQDVVKSLRKIREEISSGIKDMSFEEERMYLDKLLMDKDKSSHNKHIAASGVDE